MLGNDADPRDYRKVIRSYPGKCMLSPSSFFRMQANQTSKRSDMSTMPLAQSIRHDMPGEASWKRWGDDAGNLWSKRAMS